MVAVPCRYSVRDSKAPCCPPALATCPRGAPGNPQLQAGSTDLLAPLACSLSRLRFWSCACRAWQPASLRSAGELHGTQWVALSDPARHQRHLAVTCMDSPFLSSICSPRLACHLLIVRTLLAACMGFRPSTLPSMCMKPSGVLPLCPSCFSPALMLHACCCSPPEPAPVYTVRQVVEYAPVTFDLVATMDSILQESVARGVSSGSGLPPSADAA